MMSRVSDVQDEESKHERKILAIIMDRYRDRLERLPKEKRENIEDLYMYQGFWHFSNKAFSIETVMALQDTFKAQPTDIYMATLPKSGTTMLKALMFAIVNRSHYKNKPRSSHPLCISNPHNYLPYIETEIFRNTPTYVDVHSSRLFATHVPYTSLPRSILESGCRLVYMCRNPKDVLVSSFHFTNRLREKAQRSLMTFEEMFEFFSKGVIPYGPYWHHVKGYRKASLERPTRVLFLTYEDMKMDAVNNVKRLAEFLGYPFTEEEKVEGVVQEIVTLCSFKTLSEVNRDGNFRGVPNDAFFRNGKVGDWTNHLTDEMSRILDEITEEQFHGLDISF